MDKQSRLSSDSRLILISNGEPYVHKYKNNKIALEKLAGGLTTGLDPLMKQEGGIWIAWGRGNADFKVLDKKNKIKVPDNNGYTLKRVKLDKTEVDGFYYGFSNETLWPISHSIISKANYNPEYWKIYQQVNQKYAESALEEVQDNDLVWIHDYHLTLLPKLIKKEKKKARIAFFWHIPWPPWEAFGTIPWKNIIMKHILAADFIGFHTHSQVENFLNCARHMNADVDEHNYLVKFNGHLTKINAIPLGVDYTYLRQTAENKDMIKKAEEIKNSFNANILLIGIDRLDYTKGIINKLKAIDVLLQKYPNYIGELTLIQRISPSRTEVYEYQKMHSEINKTIGDINGRYQKGGWSPIIYFNQKISHKKLVPYFLAADIALITPLIDGMNLVAKEYIAAHKNGKLILSEFAGAAEKLNDAILVNPHHINGMAEAIHLALELSREEKIKRYKKLEENVKDCDINWWRKEFISKWMKCYD